MASYLQQIRKGRKVRAKYAASVKGRMIKAINNAKNAYISAVRKGASEAVARKQGELAAINKKAELSSVYFSPSWQSQAEVLYIVPIKPFAQDIQQLSINFWTTKKSFSIVLFAVKINWKSGVTAQNS